MPTLLESQQVQSNSAKASRLKLPSPADEPNSFRSQSTRSGVSDEVERIDSGSIDLEHSPRTPIPRVLNGLMPDLRHESPIGHGQRQLTAEYVLNDQELGRGTFSRVFKAVHKGTREPCAVKSISLARLKHEGFALQQERGIAWQVDHPNIVRMRDFFEDVEKAHLVMECCTGGTLQDMVTCTHAGLCMSQCAQYMWELLTAIAYLHHHRICHRDVKPENCLLKSRALGAPLKITDFGLARHFQKDVPMTTRVGSSHCAAPEVATKHACYDERCDVWSAGVVMFFICAGHPPFVGGNSHECLVKVINGDFTFQESEWRRINKWVKRAVQEMMTIDPKVRPSAKQLIESYGLCLKQAKDHSPNKNSCCIIS